MRREQTKPGIVAGCCFSALLFAAHEADAQVPSCLSEPAIALAEEAASPNVQVWQGDAVEEGEKALGCTEWEGLEINFLGAAAAKISGETALDAMMTQLGDIEGYGDILFWSFARSQWEPLFDEARALSEADADATREAFPPDSFEPGATFYMFLDESDRVGGMVQEGTVLASDENQLVFETENVTAGRLWVVEAIAPGGTGGLVSITRNDEGGWDYYALTRIAYTASGLFDIPEKAFVNRATALLRHTVGIPTDQEPPTAP